MVVILPYMLINKAVLFCLLLFNGINSHSQWLTYISDIKPILDKHCVQCHREGDIGPMPLTSYEEVASYGKMIQYVTSSKLMPPWYADPGYSHFSNERILSEEEIRKISDWVNTDMKEGALPYGMALSSAVSVRVLPRDPDVVISMQEAFEQYGIYMDQYQVFVLPTNLEDDKWIEAIEFVPGNKKIVRHASISISPEGSFDSLDQWDPRYGYFSFGGSGRTSDHPYWFTWSPQQEIVHYPLHSGKFLPASSDLIVHIHYGPTGIPQKDSSELRLYFAQNKITSPVITSPLINPYNLSNDSFYIAANTTKIFHAKYEVPHDIRLTRLTPQANLICRSWEIFAEIPDQQTPVRLLKINDWNFNWKQTFDFDPPVSLPEGTVIHALAKYDNTLENLCNPADQPVPITLGAHLFNELFYVHMEYIPEPYKGSDILLIGPGASCTDTLPLSVDAQTRGKYWFIIKRSGEADTIATHYFQLKNGLHALDIPIVDLPEGNYILDVFNADDQRVANHFFLKAGKRDM